ncbi:MAG: hypothetical protein JNM31_03745 [Flavobacteriales bacterium]|nr:hypothetical protein [Flavobacteriales bacterium]
MSLLRSLAHPLPFVLLAAAATAQQNDVPFERDIYLDLELNAACRGSRIHSGIKPLIQSRADLTGVMGYRPDKRKHYYVFTEKLFKEHLVEVKKDGVRLTLDPVFRFERGWDVRDPSDFADTTTFYVNSRGLWITGNIGPRLSFQTTFYENQAIFPQYIYTQAQATGVVPGQGRIKGFKNRAFDFAWAQGNVSWSPRGWINVQFGNGRHFVGHGYRSILLSDVSFNQPYFKVNVLSPDKRWQYNTIHTKLTPGVLQTDRLPTGQSSESLFYWKRAVFHHLSLDLGRVQLGLFEANIFQSIDSTGVAPISFREVNPIIGVNTLLNGFAAGQQDLVGLDIRVKLTDLLFVYGQLATDDPGRTTGWQAGFRWFRLFGKDLHLQAEYNSASRYLYMNTPARINHVHYGQPLAHPAGTWFDEFVVIVDARIKQRWLLRAQVNGITYRLDGPDGLNLGGNIFRPDPGTDVEGEPLVRQMYMLDLSAGWLMNQMTNMRLSAGLRLRDIDNAPDFLSSAYYYVAWSTSLFNRYYDF